MPTGVAYTTIAPQTVASLFCVMFPGHTITGTSTSSTVTSKLHVDVLLDASVTKYVTVVTPDGKTDPLASPAVSVVIEPGQLSAPTGVAYATVAPQTPASLFCVISAGHTIVGFCVSLTVTVKEQVAVLVEASVAKYVTVVAPIGNKVPLA